MNLNREQFHLQMEVTIWVHVSLLLQAQPLWSPLHWVLQGGGRDLL